MAKRGTITIPAPKAIEGDRVDVLNYRRKPDGVWEEGIVSSPPRYRHNIGRAGTWSYEVQLRRLSASNPSQYGRERGGNRITLTVRDDGIERKDRHG